MKNLRLALFVVFAYLFLAQLAIFAFGMRQGARGVADFRHLYTAGYMVRTGQGHELYNYEVEDQLQQKIVGPERPIPFDHLAYEALIYVPFSLLPYRAAFLLFTAVNIALLILAARLFYPRIASLRSLGAYVPYALFFCFPPVGIALILGQDSILLLTLAVLACLALGRGRDLEAGLLLSLGFFKFQLILPVALLFFLWRKWRFVLGVALGGVAAIGVSTLVAGFSGMRAFVQTMADMSVGLSTEAMKWKFGTQPSFMPNLRGLIDTLGSSHFPPMAIHAAILAASLLVIAFAWRLRPSLPLALLVAVMVSYHGLIHDASLLILPLGLLLVRAEESRNMVLGIFVVIIFVAPSLLFEFARSQYFPISLLLLAVLLWWETASRDSTELRLGAL